MFYKESLPIVIQHDLSFNECIVAELKFGRKRIFFTVLYRNPACKADSPEFEKLLTDLENLYKNVIAENPYTMLIAGEFNGHCQQWWPEGNSTKEGIAIESLTSNIGLTQLITEATNFQDNCNPSCIDLFFTDQPWIMPSTNASTRS